MYDRKTTGKWVGLVLLVFITVVYGQDFQNSISGHVYDKSSGKPIEDVNVYLSNSTWGSSTNREGFYKIRQIPEGIHELVVTVVGYEYVVKNILVKSNSELTFNFNLVPVIYETEATLIEGSVPDQWLRDLEFFKTYFLGNSVFARDCIIDNKEFLNFSRPNSTFFLATSDQPLLLINNALGYRVDCILEMFSYQNDPERWRWLIKPKFSELKTDDTLLQDKWRENRRTAYHGSVYHFLNSFKNKTLREEGYQIYPDVQAGEYIPLSEQRPTIVDYEDFLKAGTLSGEKKIGFTNYIFVVYQKDRLSWIGLNYSEITLDENGYPEEDNPFTVFGEWAKQGVANLLPKNYEESGPVSGEKD